MTSPPLDTPSLLAAARLQHHISDLQTRVASTLPPPSPPRRKIFHLIPDSTALSSPAISDLRSLVSQRRITLTVPFSALAELDRLKKGSSEVNVNVRAAIRWFDRGGAGLRFQQPEETDAEGGGEDAVVGCALWAMKTGGGGGDVFVVTDDEERARGARERGVRCVGSWEVEGMVRREEAEFNERRRAWEAGRRSGRGGRGGGVSGGMEHGGGRSGKIIIDPEEFGRSARRTGEYRGGRGVQRGRGKLWEP